MVYAHNGNYANAAAQSCPTHRHSFDCSLLGSSVHEIFQARTLEWTAISSSRGSSQPSDWTCISCTASRLCYWWATGEEKKKQKTYICLSLQKENTGEHSRKHWRWLPLRNGKMRVEKIQKGMSIFCVILTFENIFIFYIININPESEWGAF